MLCSDVLKIALARSDCHTFNLPSWSGWASQSVNNNGGKSAWPGGWPYHHKKVTRLVWGLWNYTVHSVCIGESLLMSFFRRRQRMHQLNSNVDRVCLQAITKEIADIETAKLLGGITLMSPYILCKVSTFSKLISPKLFSISSSKFHTWLIFYPLSIFREFILIAWSEDETHMRMRQRI